MEIIPSILSAVAGGLVTFFVPRWWEARGVERARREQQPVRHELRYFGKIRGYRMLSTLHDDNGARIGTFVTLTKSGARRKARTLAAQLKVWQRPPPRDLWRDTVTIRV